MMSGQPASVASATGVDNTTAPRRGDLDALRSLAMLLGVFLHASLAYFVYPWPVQDGERVPYLPLCYALVHGFRMPLFFLLSGFFTMLMLRRRGLRALLTQRALRIMLPFMIAALTILPLNKAVIQLAVGRGSAALAVRTPLLAGILTNDPDRVRASLRESPDLDAWDAGSGLTPLSLAAQGGNREIIQMLIEAGASVDGRTRNGDSPLHAAAFMGNAAAVELLLEQGADPAANNAAGQTPLAAVTAPASVAVAVQHFLGLPPRTADSINRGRDQIRRQLAVSGSVSRSASMLDRIARWYQASLASPWWTLSLAGVEIQLFETNAWDHLWFLWYLAWLIAAFAGGELLGLSPCGRHRWWLIPVTCLPAILMWSPFGPDTPLGLLPAPHLLFYYGCFFWFGAATYAAEGTATRLGQRWQVLLPLSLLVIFPVAVATIGLRFFAAVLQTAFAWGMSLGLIGLFHALLHRERPSIRWLSDASYWVYLLHLPLVIAAQAALIDHQLPGLIKLLIVLTVTVVLSLVTYRWCVRYTVIGLLLNGPRARPRRLS